MGSPARSASDDLVVVDVGRVLDGVGDHARDRSSRDPDSVVERPGSDGGGVSSRFVLKLAVDGSPRDHRAADACPGFGTQSIGNRP